MSWMAGPRGSRRPRSSVSKALPPTRRNAAASRLKGYSFARPRRIVVGVGVGTPPIVSTRERSA